MSAYSLPVLMYHYVSRFPGAIAVSPEHFEDQCRGMAEHGWRGIGLDEAEDFLLKGAPLPPRSLLITFDDGYASNYTLAFPILKEFNAKAAISPIVKRIEDGVPGFLTWDMCREMADSGLVEFGSHTYDAHRESPRGIQRMEGESREAYEARMFPDLQTSIDLLEENLGREGCFFAYPHGQTDSWSDAYLTEHFSVSVTTRHGAADIRKGLYQMPRHNITMRAPVSQYLP